jgi:ABC-type glycerol-3-phosphate transport system substrate-binding protein
MKANLQIILMVVFVAALIIGVFIFAGFIPVGSNTTVGAVGDVYLWGTVPRDQIIQPLDNLNIANKTYRIIYIQKDPATFDTDLTNALARGQGPDLFFLPDDLVFKHKDKVVTVPFTAYPQVTFTDTFISEANIYLDTDKVLAFPFLVDPMVMYYNRDMLEGAGQVLPPVSWDDFPTLVKAITTLGPSRNVIKSAVAFGEFTNINHAKDLLVAMFIQKGNPIISRVGTEFRSSLADTFGTTASPASVIFNYYSDFSNSIKDVYSWNRSMPNSLNAFIAGDLAVYFGYASELAIIKAKNPNLNFDVTKIPQTKGSTIKATFGRMNAIAISKASKNSATAYTAAGSLTSADFLGKISIALNLPPARRDLLAKKPATPAYMSTFYDSALIARSWLDPSPKDTDLLFKTIVEDISSGRLDVSQAIRKGADSLDQLLITQ